MTSVKLIARQGLKERLDKIDRETVAKGGKAYMECRFHDLHGMWRKGREVLRAYPELEKPPKGGRGVLGGFSEVERLTGRAAETVSKWVKLFLAHQDEKQFLVWAKQEAQALLAKWEQSLLPAPKVQPVLPRGKYRVIYADPPWKYSDKLIEGYGSAEHHYPQMSIEELSAQEFAELAGDNAVLFIWTTSPFLEDCFAVIRAWRFEYKSSFVWDKVKHNYGHYNSVRHELLLVCTRGSCTPDVPTLIDSVVQVERSDKHSEKPEKFREIIDTLYTPPAGRVDRIELFQRGAAPAHWKVWGNEADANCVLQETA